MLTGIGNAESMPSKDQTINFIKNTINDMLTVSILDYCADSKDDDKNINDLDYMKLDTELFYKTLRLTLKSKTCTSVWKIPLEKLSHIVLLSSENLEFMILCADENNCIEESISQYSRGQWIDGELKWRYSSYGRDAFHLRLGENTENNLKVSRRLFKALKHYAALYNKEVNGAKGYQIKAEFEDQAFEKIDGSAFD